MRTLPATLDYSPLLNKETRPWKYTD